MRSLSFLSPTRDPALSVTSTSAATSNASISVHLMSDGVGLAKIRWRVLCCLSFTMIWYRVAVPLYK